MTWPSIFCGFEMQNKFIHLLYVRYKLTKLPVWGFFWG